MIRPGPVVYFPGPDGVLSGFDADLARLFAAEKNIPLRFVARRFRPRRDRGHRQR